MADLAHEVHIERPAHRDSAAIEQLDSVVGCRAYEAAFVRGARCDVDEDP
jgi:hypothetical protein